MAINSYTTLKTAILKWLLKDSGDAYFTSDMLDNIIFLAESELSRRLRIRQMRDSATLSYTGSDNAEALPTGFLEAYSVRFTGAVSPQEIQFADAGFFARNNLYQITGQPEFFYTTEDSLILGPTPDGSYSVTLDYYKAIPNLSGSTTDNLVLLAFPDLYLFACLKQAYIASQDMEREGIYEARIDKLINEANRADRKTIAAKGTRGVARTII